MPRPWRTISRPGLLILGRGDGSFTALAPRAAGVAARQRPRALAVGDLDGDGNTDVVVTAEEDGSLAVFAGRGDGNLDGPVFYPVGEAVRAVGIGDFDGDSHPTCGQRPAPGPSSSRAGVTEHSPRRRWFPRSPAWGSWPR